MAKESTSPDPKNPPRALILRPALEARGSQLAALQECMRAFEAKPSSLAVLDLSLLADITSAGVGALVGLHQLVLSRQGSLRLAGVSDSVRHALEVAGLLPRFVIFPSVNAALDA